jgi:phosphatidate cytidylyltransferase
MTNNENEESSSLRRRGGNAIAAISTPKMMSRHSRHSSADESAGPRGGIGGMIGMASAVGSEATRYLVRGGGGEDDAASITSSSSPSLHRYYYSANRHRSGDGSNENERGPRKFATRLVSGLIMIVVFLGIILAGHVYVCGMVFVLEVLLFRELVTVRYNAYYDRIDSNIPLFRTTQWMWFFVSLFYVYSDFAVEMMIKSNPRLHDHFLGYAQLAPVISFGLYAGTFVLTISTLQAGHIRFQLNQLCWTIVVLCLTVGQLKYIMHNVYNGLIWFTLPILLVITNDVMAYFSGITCGRKFVQRPFMELSPNKTWEGFIGGGIFTLIVGWYLSRFLAGWNWMTCPTNTFDLFPRGLECEVENVFQRATTYFPSQAFELFPRALIRLWPNVVELCIVVVDDVVACNGDAADGGNNIIVRPCISGVINQKHHHWELALDIVPIQLHALSLSLFASLVAPFGGFLASGIKRAYRIKDFDSIIPGHGGLMDRFDCQLIMALGKFLR